MKGESGESGERCVKVGKVEESRASCNLAPLSFADNGTYDRLACIVNLSAYFSLSPLSPLSLLSPPFPFYLTFFLFYEYNYSGAMWLSFELLLFSYLMGVRDMFLLHAKF